MLLENNFPLTHEIMHAPHIKMVSEAAIAILI